MVDGEAKIAGTMVVQHRQVMEERYGKPVVARAIAALDEALRAELGRALPGAWVRLEVLQGLYGEVSRETGSSVEELHTAVTRESTARTVRTVWRMLLRMSTDDALVGRTPEMYKKAFSRGEVTSRLTGSHQSENVLSGWPDVPDFVLRQVRVATAEVLRLAGRSEITVQVERRPDGAVYTTSWR
jgi:hypothetical protein